MIFLLFEAKLENLIYFEWLANHKTTISNIKANKSMNNRNSKPIYLPV